MDIQDFYDQMNTTELTIYKNILREIKWELQYATDTKLYKGKLFPEYEDLPWNSQYTIDDAIKDEMRKDWSTNDWFEINEGP